MSNQLKGIYVMASLLLACGATYDVGQLHYRCDAPTANDDSFTVAEDSGATVLDVLANDSSAPDAGETLTVTVVTQPANGTVTFTVSNVSFTPAPNFVGTTAFTYTVTDGNGGSDTALVTVTVTAVNNPPMANDDSFTVE